MAAPVLQAIAAPGARSRRAMPASLFSCDGKLAVSLLALTDETVLVATRIAPRPGSVAVLSRNGVRLTGTVEAADGPCLTLRFDDPLEDWRRDWLIGAACDPLATDVTPAHADPVAIA